MLLIETSLPILSIILSEYDFLPYETSSHLQLQVLPTEPLLIANQLEVVLLRVVA